MGRLGLLRDSSGEATVKHSTQGLEFKRGDVFCLKLVLSSMCEEISVARDLLICAPQMSSSVQMSERTVDTNFYRCLGAM